MATDDDLWDAQIGRLLRGYREPEIDAARVDAIGRSLAERLRDDRVLEGNLESLLPGYQEPDIPQDRLDQLGSRLAGMMDETPRRARPRVRATEERHGFLWAAATIAAGILLIIAFTEPTKTPAPQPLLKPIAIQPQPVSPPAPTPIDPIPPKETPPPTPERAVTNVPQPTPEPPKPEPPPVPAAPPKPERTTSETVAAPAPATLAVLERVEGSVEWIQAGARSPAQAGVEIPALTTLETGGTGRAVLKYKDGTIVDLGPASALQLLAPATGAKELSLSRGTLGAEVVPQPAGRPLVIATPHAEARVLGTQFTLSAGSASARLEVREGKVRFTRKPDGAGVDVPAGHFAVAARGVAMLTRPLPEDPKRILIEVEELPSVRGTKPADGMVRRPFLEPFDTASGDWCLSIPAAGMEAAGDFKLAKGNWYLWVRYRDEPGTSRISFNLLLGDQVVGQMSTPGKDRSWIWKRVAFAWGGGAARITLRSTFDGIKATPAQSDFRQSPYGALNRWDRLCLTPDEAYTPE